MCGRGRFACSAAQVAQACGCSASLKKSSRGPTGGEVDFAESNESLTRENFGPGMSCWIVCRNGEGDAELRRAQWGLIRSSSREPVTSSSFFKMFNAREDRLDVVHPKLIGSKHCVIVFNGFYEWQKSMDKLTNKEIKQPYYVFAKASGVDGQLCMAGLYDEYVDPETKETRTTFTIITVPAARSLQWLHDRMPAVLLDQQAIHEWLGAVGWTDTVRRLLFPVEEGLAWHPVTKAIGSTKYQDPSCSLPVKLPKPPPSVSSFFAAKSSKEEKKVEEDNKPSPSTDVKSDQAIESPNLKRERKSSTSQTEAVKSSEPKRPKVGKGQSSLHSFFTKNYNT